MPSAYRDRSKATVSLAFELLARWTIVEVHDVQVLIWSRGRACLR